MKPKRCSSDRRVDRRKSSQISPGMEATHPAASTAWHVPIHIRPRRPVNNTGRPICTLLARKDLRSRRRNSLSDDRYSVKIARKDRCQTRKRTRPSPLLLHSSSRAGLLTTTARRRPIPIGCDSHKSPYLTLIQPALGLRFPRSR